MNFLPRTTEDDTAQSYVSLSGTDKHNLSLMFTSLHIEINYNFS